MEKIINYAVEPVQPAVRRLCTALDGLETLEEIVHYAKMFAGKARVIKFNSTFVSHHRALIRLAQRLGYVVWVDLKTHDTPRTARNTLRALAKLGVNIASIHLSGGAEMIRYAVEGGNPDRDPECMLILGITVLTHISQQGMNEEMYIKGSVGAHVIHLAEMGVKNGIGGLVSSVKEVGVLRRNLGDVFIATPGMVLNPSRSMGEREGTPQEAAEKGSSLIVLGNELLREGISGWAQACYQILQGDRVRAERLQARTERP